MKRSIRTALWGAGLSGRHLHLPALRRLPEFDLVAIVDPSEQALDAIGPPGDGARCFKTPETCLQESELEAVVIAAPNVEHAKLAGLAFGNGLHVYLEKPLAVSPDASRHILESWRRSHRAGQIGFNYRWNPLHRQAREWIREGRIGLPIAVQTQFCSEAHRPALWRLHRETGGGVLLDRCSHHFDLLEWYFDSPIRWMEAELGSRGSEHDTATVQAGLESGLTAQLFASFDGFDTDRWTVFGEQGGIEIDRYETDFPRLISARRKGQRRRRWIQASREVFSLPLLRRKLQRGPEESSYEAALREFAAAITGERQPCPDLNAGYRSMILLEAAERAAVERRRIEVGAEGYAGSAD